MRLRFKVVEVLPVAPRVTPKINRTKVVTPEPVSFEGQFKDIKPEHFAHLFTNFKLTQTEIETLTASILVLDSTKLDTYIGCPRKFLFNSIIGLTPGFISGDTVFGVAIHEALSVLYESGRPMAQTWMAAQDAFVKSYAPYVGIVKDSKTKNLDRGRESIQLYAMVYGESDKTFKKVGVAEAAYIMDINGVPFVVKPDLIVSDSEGLVHVIEHKTTGLLSRTWFSITYPSLQPGAYTKYLFESGICPKDKVSYPLLNLIVYPTSKVMKPSDMFFREYFGAEYGSPSAYAEAWQLRTARHLRELYQDLRLLMNTDIDTTDVVEAFPMKSNCYKYGQVCPYSSLCHSYSNPLKVCQKSEAEVMQQLFAINIWNPLHQFKKNQELFKAAIFKQQELSKDGLVFDRVDDPNPTFTFE